MDARTPQVVVGVDGSELSVQALEWAAVYAQLVGAEVLAVTVWDIPASIFVTLTTTEEEVARGAIGMLNRVTGEVAARHPGVTFHERVVEQRPSIGLVRAARDADLLVIGSHGRGELPGVHLGSVASYCLHHAPCPVLVYRRAASGR